MLRKSKKDDSGVKLEVNGRILDSCTDLMGVWLYIINNSNIIAVNVVHQATDPEVTRTTRGNCRNRKSIIIQFVIIHIMVCLQGGLSANEFYKKNNRWSEGLISAAKAVGWGASILV